jgi:hypothetical protein
MCGRYLRRGAARGWVVGAAVGAAATVALTWLALQHLAHVGWAMTGRDIAAAFARAGLVGGSLGALVGAASDWSERLWARQGHAEPDAPPDPAARGGSGSS